MKSFIGICVYRLDLRDCMSLKDKRRIVKSIVERLGKSSVMCASETGDSDYWKTGVVTLACVSGSHRVINESLDKARETIEGYGVPVTAVETWTLSTDDL